MRASIASDHEPTTVRVREILLREGQDCPVENAHSLDLAVDRLVLQHPQLIVVAMTPDPDHALGVVSQLRVQTQVPVLAVGPAADARLVLRALRTGASDYIDEAELLTELPAALGRMARELATTEPKLARTIAVLAPSGGSGSSTVAVNVATLLAKEHASALLVDLKLQTGDLAALLDLKPTHTIADLCLNAARLDRIMFERSLVRHKSGVHLLAPPRSLADIKHVSAAVRQVVNLGRSLFPYVVVDLDHSFQDEQLQVLRQADVILLLLRLDFTCLGNTRRTLDYLGDLGIDPDRVRVVVNRYGQAKEVPAAKAEEALGVKIFHYIPEDPKTVNRANNTGLPVVLESPWAKVSRSLDRLTSSVNGRSH